MKVHIIIAVSGDQYEARGTSLTGGAREAIHTEAEDELLSRTPGPATVHTIIVDLPGCRVDGSCECDDCTIGMEES